MRQLIRPWALRDVRNLAACVSRHEEGGGCAYISYIATDVAPYTIEPRNSTVQSDHHVTEIAVVMSWSG